MALLYDIAKDAATMAMNLQNFELTQKLLEVQQKAIEMQDENSRLKEERLSSLKIQKSRKRRLCVIMIRI